MKKFRKELIKEVEELKKIESNENENAIIKVHVEDASHVISPFSLSEKPMITKEFAEILENQYLNISKKKKIEIEVEGLPNPEFDQLEQAKKNYYRSSIISAYDSEKRLKIISLILMIIGILILVCMFILDRFEVFANSQIAHEVIDIAAWVFIWESVTLYFIERQKVTMNLVKYIRLARAELKEKEK